MSLAEASFLRQTASLYVDRAHGRTVFEDICNPASRCELVVRRYFNPIDAHPSDKIGKGRTTIRPIWFPMQVAIGQCESISVFSSDIRDAGLHPRYAFSRRTYNGYELTCQATRRQLDLETSNGHSVLEVGRRMEEVRDKMLPLSIAWKPRSDIAQCWANPVKAVNSL
ncbi:hypothetical protein NT2_12_01015 [Caenibius tardaugens NBRC 16725]|uniref:Uncharacterized protein n=1 Tax=Caenibius tardaugens NBRC 16725 TaxID=1219035 RepID=U3A7X5_9SPHN|nr:hypothetical protein NT2_12_01015 [Caenibius tardaugens NBRC 16725]